MSNDEDIKKSDAKEFARISVAIGIAIICRDMAKRDRHSFIELAKDHGLDAALSCCTGCKASCSRTLRSPSVFDVKGK